jgi:hypothetical protein
VRIPSQVSVAAVTDFRIGSSSGVIGSFFDLSWRRLDLAVGKTPWVRRLPSPRAFYGNELHPPSAMLPFGIFAEARVRPWRLSSPLSTDGFFGVAKR